MPAQFHSDPLLSPTSLSLEAKAAMTPEELWALEKRRRRRESHNAVERRRRDNINDRITELSMIVPDCIEDSSSPQKPNKGVILRKSADYIKYLQEANMRLQKQLAQNGITPLPDTDIHGPYGLPSSRRSSNASTMTAGAGAAPGGGGDATLADGGGGYGDDMEMGEAGDSDGGFSNM